MVSNTRQHFKRIRHPNILTYIDEEIDENQVSLITEHVIPLKSYLKNIKTFKNNIIQYGILTIFDAFYFLITSCSLSHPLTLDSIFINDRHEWKLGAFEYLTEKSKNNLSQNNFPASFSHLSSNVSSLLTLIYDLFNQDSHYENIQKIPKIMRSAYSVLLTKDSDENKFQNFKNSTCFSNNFILLMKDLANIQVATNIEVVDLIKKHNNLMTELPLDFQANNILFHLINKYNFGGIIPELIEMCLEIIVNLEKLEEFAVNFLLNLYQSSDRQIKSMLFKNHCRLVKKLNNKQINDIVFPSVLLGLSETSPYFKESALKATVCIASEISPQNISSKLLPLLARVQVDPNPIIRANTNVCIGKIANYIPTDILLIALVRGLKDNFDLSRRAALLTIQANVSSFNLLQISQKLIPGCCMVMIDSSKEIKLLVVNTLKSLIDAVSTMVEKIEDTKIETISTTKTIGDWFASNLLNIKPGTTSSENNVKINSGNEKLITGEIDKIMFKEKELNSFDFEIESNEDSEIENVVETQPIIKFSDNINEKKSSTNITKEKQPSKNIIVEKKHSKTVVNENQKGDKNIGGWDWNDDW